ncbi:MAG: ester cyclase [Blastocatellia bacterium]|nr:ester cyclase [Blastocatellia bacterium]
MPSDTSSQDNKAIARRIFDEMWNKGNLDIIDELYAPKAACYDLFMPDLELGREDTKERVRTYRNAFPDLKVSIENLLCEKNIVIIRWTGTATHKGELLGIAPTGKRVKSSGTTTYQFRNGKVVKEWVNWNPMQMMTQLGLLPQWITNRSSQ